jgi:acyl-CoA thioesterase
MTFLLADSAMAFASNSENDVAFATSAGIDWVAPATAGQWLTATAERRSVGGRSTVWDVTVTSSDDRLGDQTTIAHFRGRTRKVGRPVVESEEPSR